MVLERSRFVLPAFGLALATLALTTACGLKPQPEAADSEQDSTDPTEKDDSSTMPTNKTSDSAEETDDPSYWDPDAGVQDAEVIEEEDAAPAPGTGMDKFGISEIYPTKSGGEEWFMNMDKADNDSRFDPKQSIKKNGDGSWNIKNNQVRMNVFTSTGYKPGNIKSYDPDSMTKQGYMQAANDWKNVEMTGYVKLGSGSNDSFTWYARGGKHTDSDGGCEGTSYKGDLGFDGKVRMAKESWHVSYDFSDYKSGGPSSKGKWVGFKMILYNVQDGGKTTVKAELYTVAGENKTDWKKVYEFKDDGKWAGDMGKCGGGDKKMAIVWGGPIATFRWDNASSVDFKWLSVREIEPPTD